MRWLLTLGALVGTASACISPAAEPATTGILRGTIDTAGADAGNGFVFLYPANNPPPPTGTGRPVQVTGVPEERLFGGQSPNPDFVFADLTPNDYLARGIVDVRHLFDPFIDVMAQPFAGDIDEPRVGVSAIAGQTGFVHLPQGKVVAWEPPMFVMDTLPSEVKFTLGSTEQVLSIIHLTATPLPFAEPSLVAFQFQAMDGGGLETYPQVVIERIPQPTDGPEFNDANGNPLTIVLAATAQPDASSRNDLINGQQVVNGMYVFIAPIAEVASTPDGGGPTTTTQLPSLPLGTYAIIVVEPDGRYWQVPNDLAPGQPLASEHGGPYVTQGPRFEVVP